MAESLEKLETGSETLELSDDLNPSVDQVSLISAVDRDLDSKLRKWEREQEALKSNLVLSDSPAVLSWSKDRHRFAGLELVGGVDISFNKENPEQACAALVVLSFPALEVQHTCYVHCTMSEPYISGFLAFREVPHLLKALGDLESMKPWLMPQVILVDGNGVLHKRGFGLASHLGVLADIPTIGVAKKLHEVDGLVAGQEHKDKLHEALVAEGSTLDLVGKSGQMLGRAVRTGKAAVNPVYVSVGHNISLDTATELVLQCSKYRIPEPVRQADILSRKIIVAVPEK